MSDFTLKNLGIMVKDVKEACTSFNNAKLVDTKIKLVGVTGEAMLIALLKAIDSLTEDATGNIPADVTAFYDSLPDAVFNVNIDASLANSAIEEPKKEEKKPGTKKPGTKKTAPVETPAAQDEPDTVEGTDAEPSEEPAEGGQISDCPTYGKGWNIKDAACQKCNEDFHKDYVSCKRTVKGISVATSGKKSGRNVGTPGKIHPRSSVPHRKAGEMLSRYGHRINSMGAIIDDLVWAGTHFTEIVKATMKWHGRDEVSAKAKVKGHIGWLIKTRGINVTNADGVFKSVEEYIPSQDATNTAPAEPSVEQ